MPDNLVKKLELLKDILNTLDSAAVAFSGGTDSALLMKIAHDVLGERAVAVTACSCAFPKRELKEARELAEKEGIRHILFEFSAFEIPEFGMNPPDRCYYCKRAILGEIKKIAEREGLARIIEGSNVDDDRDYRPGARAIREQKVRSPLKEAGLTKQEVRSLSKELGLPTWQKQSAACLASRIAYGEPITEEKLAMAERAEAFLHDCGFAQLRVRMHGRLARIELEEEALIKAVQGEFRGELTDKFRELGFSYVTLDLQGYRMGSMNELLED